MKIELIPHTAAARHPITREILRDDDGNQISKFPEQREFRVDGMQCGFCTAKDDKPLIFTEHFEPHIRDTIAAEVERQLGFKVRDVSSVPSMESIEQALGQTKTDEEDDDE